MKRAREWLRRYLPAEIAATLGALLGAWLGRLLFGHAGATALSAAIGESVLFYVYLFTRDLRRERRVMLTVRNLMLEFGPAELLDGFMLRPLAMYLGPQLVNHLAVGVILGKVTADVTFYALAIVGYELRRKFRAGEAEPLFPRTLDEQRYPTPYLLMDLDQVERAYATLREGLGVDALHYAMKCNPEPEVLATLHRLGCHFEVASYPELSQLRDLGVDPETVLYSNPVKPTGHIRRAFAAGLWRFAADSSDELSKLAEHAPGCAVYVRLRVLAETMSAVPSEGKFGVDPEHARELLREAKQLGLRPYGLAFHVGSQMTDPTAWEKPVAEAGELMRELSEQDDIRLELLDIGGGFPARYTREVPAPAEFGAAIRESLERHLPYRPQVVAEPGRALVAEPGILVGTVIGRAVRGGKQWVHLDVGAFNGMMETLETGNTLVFPLGDSRRSPSRMRCNVTGPTCDSQDTLFFDVELSDGLVTGDRVYIGTAGAYTTAYASRFNGFDLPRTFCVSTRQAEELASVPG